MTTQVQNEIQRITDKIVKDYQPEKIILFGSYAWGKPTKDSDIDLMIIKETDDTRKASSEIRGNLWDSNFAMDIIVKDPVSVNKRVSLGDPFLIKIFSHGKTIYQSYDK